MNEKRYKEIKDQLRYEFGRKGIIKVSNEGDRYGRKLRMRMMVMREEVELRDKELRNVGLMKRLWDWMMWLMDDDYIGYGRKRMRRWG